MWKAYPKGPHKRPGRAKRAILRVRPGGGNGMGTAFEGNAAATAMMPHLKRVVLLVDNERVPPRMALRSATGMDPKRIVREVTLKGSGCVIAATNLGRVGDRYELLPGLVEERLIGVLHLLPPRHRR